MSARVCTDPALGRLAEGAIGGREAAPPGLAPHLEECAACRVRVERARRMALVWGAIALVEPERHSHARLTIKNRAGGVDRVALRPDVPSRRRRAAPALLIAFALSFASVVAVAGARLVVSLPRLTSPPAATAPSPPPATAASSRAGRARGSGRTGAPSPSEPAAEAIAAPTASSPPEQEPLLALSPPAPVVRAAPPPASPPPRLKEHPRTTIERSTPPPPSDWATAAQALRARDYPTAERAFAALARSSEPATRDEARLSLAQVRLAGPRAAEARAELEELAAHGATLFVRRRALAALSESASPKAAGSGTNTP